MSQRSDLRRRRTTLESEWTRWVPRLKEARLAPGGAALRPEVTESWLRSLSSVDPERDCAPDADGDPVARRWAASPLRRPVDELAGELHSIAADAGFVTGVTDESGTLLWTCGGRRMRQRAEQVNFAPGGRWDEVAMGTNALSLALRTGRPSTVFSAEHLVSVLHGWVCYCAPVHAPDGRVLGVLDLSTTWDRSHPLAMSTVRSLVTAIESRLAAEARVPGTAPAGPATPVRLSCLGVERAERGGTLLPVRPRQLEILALLALEPDGFTPEQLRAALYGDRPVTTSTFKAEVSHLRRALGGGITPRRYALTTAVACDAVEVLRALERGDTATALHHYRGPLLPRSEAPGVVEWRARIEVAVREAVLASRSPEHALRYGDRAPYDAEVHEHALRLLAPDDTRRSIAAGRLSTALVD
ncbi:MULTISPECIES: transcriptional regulator [unclassified Streptomyces]|uniref:transcriptional regulator n=1 Tax=unclassified Streptomyces TaxID=2593676 RepID=UPI001F047A59|nr:MULTISPECIES: transcriptional regulator [unclassified Streptomyces]MCH0565906.1 transcriptional regulator [Streptomyces sp. MUM 2J]MCH0569071.1 transcriptional regulator [Streptomyces sp. MUM 136J]